MIAGNSCYEHLGTEPDFQKETNGDPVYKKNTDGDFELDEDGRKVKIYKETFVVAEQKENCVYPFGFDPIWYRSEQEIVFLNGFKMKTSVIFGVMQMLLGTFMKGFNAVYFKRWVELVFDVFTQIALLMALFGFMDIMIFVKWMTDWDAVEKRNQYIYENHRTPEGEAFSFPDGLMNKNIDRGETTPSIIQTMIVMFIRMGTPPATIVGKNP
jgi:vacuolar-type H+-ATPase subunit I/STV1